MHNCLIKTQLAHEQGSVYIISLNFVIHDNTVLGKCTLNVVIFFTVRHCALRSVIYVYLIPRIRGIRET